MSNFMETYCKAIFVLVIVAILIAFASPLGLKIKEYTTAKVNNTDKIGIEEITKVTSGKKNYNESNRPAEPKEAVDSLWCYLDKNGE